MAALKIKDSVIKTVIFDFDGTLAKLNIDFARMRQEVTRIISSYGIEPDAIQDGFILETIQAAASLMKNDSAKKAQEFRQESMNFIENMEMQAAQKGELFPSTRELLSFLTSNDISSAVVSRNCQKAIFTVFPDILSFCEAVICRDAVEKVKPDHLHLRAALEKTSGNAASALMVGDHPLDIEAGRHAGTFTAGVLTGNFQAADFQKAKADIILPRASSLMNMIV